MRLDIFPCILALKRVRDEAVPDKALLCNRGLEVTEVETEELTENNFRGSASDLQDHDGIFRWGRAHHGVAAVLFVEHPCADGVGCC